MLFYGGLMNEERRKKEEALREVVEVTLFNNEKPQEVIKGKVNNFRFAYAHGSKVKVPIYVLDFLKTLKYRKWESDGSGYIQMDSISIHYHEDGLKQRSDNSNNPVRGLLEMQPIPNTFTQEEAIGKILEGMGLDASPAAVQMFVDQLKGKAGQISQPMEPDFPQEPENDPEIEPEKAPTPVSEEEDKTRAFIEDNFLKDPEE